MKHYIFSVDGTLADLESPMDPNFMRWFEHWMLKQNVYLCTNNTYQNILPRLGRRILERSVATFVCGGNAVWIKNKEAIVKSWRPPSELISFLEAQLKNSPFKFRSGPNIEYRTGMISFSVAGKSATEEDRKRYVSWDKQTKERSTLIETINKQFPDVFVCRVGEIDIDIMPGVNKSQILQYFKNEKIMFIGSDFSKNSDEKPLKTAVEERGGDTHQVHGWSETYKFLQTL